VPREKSLAPSRDRAAVASTGPLIAAASSAPITILIIAQSLRFRARASGGALHSKLKLLLVGQLRAQNSKSTRSHHVAVRRAAAGASSNTFGQKVAERPYRTRYSITAPEQHRDDAEEDEQCKL